MGGGSPEQAQPQSNTHPAAPVPLNRGTLPSAERKCGNAHPPCANQLRTPGAAIHAGPSPNNPEQIRTNLNTAEHPDQIEPPSGSPSAPLKKTSPNTIATPTPLFPNSSLPPLRGEVRWGVGAPNKHSPSPTPIPPPHFPSTVVPYPQQNEGAAMPTLRTPTNSASQARLPTPDHPRTTLNKSEQT